MALHRCIFKNPSREGADFLCEWIDNLIQDNFVDFSLLHLSANCL